jgi:integrase
MAELYQRKGSPYWQAYLYGPGGQVRRTSTGERDRRKAQKVADQKERDFVVELDTQKKRESTITLIQAQARRWREVPVCARTKINHTNFRTALVGHFGDVALTDITTKGCLEYRGARLDEKSPLRVHLELRHLHMLMESATGWDVGIEFNPVINRVKKGLSFARKRKRWLTFEEYERLLAAVCRSKGMRLIMEIGVLTGLRAGEMWALNWQDIDFTRRLIMVRQEHAKTDVQREVPIPQQLLNTLLRTRASVRNNGPTDPVITTHHGKRYSTANSICSNFLVIVNRTGIKGVSIHVLRHTFASWQIQRGVQTLAVQALLGHSSESMTGRYAHPGDRYLQEVMGEFSTNSATHSNTKHSTLSSFFDTGTEETTQKKL